MPGADQVPIISVSTCLAQEKLKSVFRFCLEVFGHLSEVQGEVSVWIKLLASLLSHILHKKIASSLRPTNEKTKNLAIHSHICTHLKQDWSTWKLCNALSTSEVQEWNCTTLKQSSLPQSQPLVNKWTSPNGIGSEILLWKKSYGFPSHGAGQNNFQSHEMVVLF